MINSACVRIHWRTLPDSLEPCTCRQQASQLLCFSITHPPALQSETTTHFLSSVFFFKPISLFRSINTHKQHSTSLQQAGVPDNIILCTKTNKQKKM